MSKLSAQIALINPKSPSNVGAALRAAGCYQAERVFYTGQRFDRAAKFQTDTKRRIQTTPLEKISDVLKINLDSDAEFVCVELVEGATALADFAHPKHAIYIFGPEDGSVSQNIVDNVNHVVYIPTVGCMNLAASVNVVLYDRQSKLGLNMPKDGRNNLICDSRDRNNRLKVRVK